jgi:4-carboxymuconolactone decarboxylase
VTVKRWTQDRKSFATGAVRWPEAARFRASIEGGRLIGPFNPTLLTPGLSSAFMDLAVAEQKHTSLSKRSREVIILTVGAVWQAPYELCSHCARRSAVCLSEDEVVTLADGRLPKGLTDAETVAHRVARALSIEHRLDEVLSGRSASGRYRSPPKPVFSQRYRFT